MARILKRAGSETGAPVRRPPVIATLWQLLVILEFTEFISYIARIMDALVQRLGNEVAFPGHFSRRMTPEVTRGVRILSRLSSAGMRRGLAFEFKFNESPAPTKSMRVAITDLKLKRLFVVYPGSRRFELDDDLIALPLTGLPAESASL